MEYQVSMVPQPRQPYVAVRATVPMAGIGEAMGPLFERLYGWLGAHTVSPVGPPFTRYLEVGSDEVELEIAAPVGEVPAVDATVTAGVLPAGEVATTLHVGPYDRLPDAYAAVNGWLAKAGWQISGAMWETYENGPDSEPDPARWRTVVSFPVAPA
jgi:effector-binding domain-containing protein